MISVTDESNLELKKAAFIEAEGLLVRLVNRFPFSDKKILGGADGYPINISAQEQQIDLTMRVADWLLGE